MSGHFVWHFYLETGEDDAAEEDIDEGGGMTLNETPETHPKVAPRWPTRVFATECVRRVMAVCETKRAHFDLTLARELREKTGEGKKEVKLLRY